MGSLGSASGYIGKVGADELGRVFSEAMCAQGIVFPTPRDGVRGQIQLLLNYADPDSRVANLHNPLSPYVWHSEAAFDNYFAKGWAPTWSDMGHGNWATDPTYAGKVIGVYHSMTAFAGGS